MDFKPGVSIVIPVYNGSNYMREAIDSALAQTYNNTEVIVVNDGSDDRGKTEEIAQSYGDSIRYFSKENGGVATALNLAISEMTGAYFSWLSHDDVYYPNKIEVQVDYLRTIRETVILYSDFDFIDSNSNFLRTYKVNPVANFKFRYALITEPPINGCTILIPKVCFDEVGLFNKKWRTTQDYELWLRMAEKFEFKHVPEVLIKSRIHPEQGGFTERFFHDELNALYISCLEKFSHKELLNMTGERSVATVYGNLAINFKKREVLKASSTALSLAKKFLDLDSGLLKIKSKFLIGFCNLWNRGFSSQYWVRLIKKLIY